jgi:hypothetical protein
LVPVAQIPERIVLQWIEAFNSRDLDGMLTRLRHEHHVVLSDAPDVGNGQVFAAGSLSLAGEPDLGQFCARFTDSTTDGSSPPTTTSPIRT